MRKLKISMQAADGTNFGRGDSVARGYRTGWPADVNDSGTRSIRASGGSLIKTAAKNTTFTAIGFSSLPIPAIGWSAT